MFYDPERGRALGVTIQEVIGAIEGRNIFSTGGKISEAGSDKQVVLRGLYEEPQAVEMTPLRARPNGGVLRIGDVARVEKGLAENGLRVRTNGKPGISIAIRKKDNVDIIDTVDTIMSEVGDYYHRFSGVGVGFRERPFVSHSKQTTDHGQQWTHRYCSGGADSLSLSKPSSRNLSR